MTRVLAAPVPARPEPAAAQRARDEREEERAARAAVLERAARSPAAPLEPGVRRAMEERFGHDFGRVRIHAGPDAAEAAGALEARAFTRGQHLFFAAGAFRPASPTGLRLLAHELAHAVQQGNADPSGLSPASPLTTPGDAAERQASAVARAATAGRAVDPGALSSPAPAVPGLVARQTAAAEVADQADADEGARDEEETAETVEELLRAIRRDPGDRQGNVHLRISSLGDLARGAVLDRVRGRLDPAEREAADRVAGKAKSRRPEEAKNPAPLRPGPGGEPVRQDPRQPGLPAPDAVRAAVARRAPAVTPPPSPVKPPAPVPPSAAQGLPPPTQASTPRAPAAAGAAQAASARAAAAEAVSAQGEAAAGQQTEAEGREGEREGGEERPVRLADRVEPLPEPPPPPDGAAGAGAGASAGGAGAGGAPPAPPAPPAAPAAPAGEAAPEAESPLGATGSIVSLADLLPRGMGGGLLRGMLGQPGPGAGRLAPVPGAGSIGGLFALGGAIGAQEPGGGGAPGNELPLGAGGGASEDAASPAAEPPSPAAEAPAPSSAPAPGAGPTPAPEAGAGGGGAPAAEAAEPEVDPEAARAKAQALAKELGQAHDEAEAQIRAGAEQARREVVRRVAQVRAAAAAQTEAAVRRVQDAYAARRRTVDASFRAAHAQVDSQLSARRAEAQTAGTAGRARMQAVFDDHRRTIQGHVSTAVADAEALRTRYATRVSTRGEEQANEAVAAARRVAGGYASDERGRHQAAAANRVGAHTAQEIRNRTPAGVAKVEEVTAPLPEQFRKGGDDALQGYDQKLPELLQAVDDQTASTLRALDARAATAHRQLDTQATEAAGALDAGETAAVARVRGVGAQAAAQLDAGQGQAVRGINGAVAPAAAQIRALVLEGVQLLLAAPAPDPDSCRRFADQVRGFAQGGAEAAVEQIRTGAQGMAGEFPRLLPGVAQGVRAVERAATTELARTGDSIAASISTFVGDVDRGYGDILTAMDASVGEMETQARRALAPSAADLKTRFDGMLREAETQISGAVAEGLAHNDEGVAQVPASAREAASDAGWDYDHPVLSTLRDVGLIVAGIIVGIVAALVLVVVAIAVITALVAALVYLGVPALVAQVIVGAIAVGLLLVGLYVAYDRRVAAGQSGPAAFGGAVLDILGLSEAASAFTDPNLTPFQAGYALGHGLTTFASFFFGAKINKVVVGRLPPAITNPSQGAAWAALGRLASRARGGAGALAEGAAAVPIRAPVVEPPVGAGRPVVEPPAPVGRPVVEPPPQPVVEPPAAAARPPVAAPPASSPVGPLASVCFAPLGAPLRPVVEPAAGRPPVAEPAPGRPPVAEPAPARPPAAAEPPARTPVETPGERPRLRLVQPERPPVEPPGARAAEAPPPEPAPRAADARPAASPRRGEVVDLAEYRASRARAGAPARGGRPPSEPVAAERPVEFAEAAGAEGQRPVALAAEEGAGGRGGLRVVGERAGEAPQAAGGGGGGGGGRPPGGGGGGGRPPGGGGGGGRPPGGGGGVRAPARPPRGPRPPAPGRPPPGGGGGGGGGPPRPPRINLEHVFHGEINAQGRAVGFHHEGSIGHQVVGPQGTARLVPGTATPPNANGVYRASVEVFDQAAGAWVRKGPASTFFPKAWSRAQVLAEIRGAFARRAAVPGRPANYWEGVSPSGVRIGGYTSPAGDINTAFPTWP